MLGVGFLLKTLPSGTQEQGDTHSLKVVRVRVLQITPENPWPLVVAAILNGVLSAKGALQEGREWCGELPVSDLGFLQAVVRKSSASPRKELVLLLTVYCSYRMYR